MIRYLLDRDVMSQLDQPEPARHKNVNAWLRSIPDSALHVGAISVVEAWRGLEKARRAAAGQPESLTACDRFEDAFARLLRTFDGRIVVVDERIAKLWGRLRGRSDKNQWISDWPRARSFMT